MCGDDLDKCARVLCVHALAFAPRLPRPRGATRRTAARAAMVAYTRHIPEKN
jgi:hypothetical protein